MQTTSDETNQRANETNQRSRRNQRNQPAKPAKPTNPASPPGQPAQPANQTEPADHRCARTSPLLIILRRTAETACAVAQAAMPTRRGDTGTKRGEGRQGRLPTSHLDGRSPVRGATQRWTNARFVRRLNRCPSKLHAVWGFRFSTDVAHLDGFAPTS